MIIDFHTHTFPAKISSKVLAKLSRSSHTSYFTEGSAADLLESMREAQIAYSVNLPVLTNAQQAEKVNGSLIEDRENLFRHGIITFGGMHPDDLDYKKELRRLKENNILGIKIHPAYQNTDLDDIRMMRIISYASELGLIVVTHAGIDIGIYDRNYASVSHIQHVIREIQPEKFVLAHMGNWACWDEVEHYLAGAPVYFDTAFAIGPVTPSAEDGAIPYLTENLTEEAFVRIVRKHGSDKILFATDSPWESQKDYVSRIEHLPLNGQEKEQIFSGNAKKLLHLQ